MLLTIFVGGIIFSMLQSYINGLNTTGWAPIAVTVFTQFIPLIAILGIVYMAIAFIRGKMTT
jgi:hypothetical protein